MPQLQVTYSGGTVDNQSKEATYVGEYQSRGTSRKIPVARYQSQDTSRELPVARYQSRGTSRKIPVAGTLALYCLPEMASSLISNSHHIDFESVFGLDDAGMVQMFETLIATGLKEFLGCPAVFYEDALTEFFANSSVREDGMVVSTIGGTAIEISQEMFAAAFELPTEGLIDLTDVPKNFVFDARSLFSDSKEQVRDGSSIQTNSEIGLCSSDGSTVYRSLSPISPEVDSFENDLRFALGPAIFSSVEQEERLYFLQSPESPPASSLHQESSSSSTDVSLHFDSADIPVHDQAATQASAPVDFSMIADALEDLRSSLAQCILDSNCEILSKVNAVELGVRGDLLKLQVLLRQSLENACRVLERQGTTQATQINDLKKGLMAPVGTIFQDLFDIKKKQREQDAKLIALDGQIAAIRSEQLDFQTKIAADILSLSTQVGDIADYIRGGVVKKGEIGSSSRPSTVRTQTLPPTTGTFAERAEQARRHIIESGQVITIEEAAERVIEADRRESDRIERERARERRERRLSRSGAYKRRRG
ncbi:hypothetical protein F511_42152 [Dorcoceras hygrometricum]|uniref:Uncharacterized protein n=1 Tax=Dorcoceras hygrometricum TaxID=472368 RepID=A0A2Z7BLN4_9LAMI|nr:hypothetical protein F511_42152 [Dorcoceras hygrometricum]